MQKATFLFPCHFQNNNNKKAALNDLHVDPFSLYVYANV